MAQYIHANQGGKMFAAFQAEAIGFLKNERQGIGGAIVGKKTYAENESFRMAKAVRGLKGSFSMRFQAQFFCNALVDGADGRPGIDQGGRRDMSQIGGIVSTEYADR